MQLSQLEYVVEVVKCKSINKAAEHLFISQPNISKSIKNLEHELGIEIFDRTYQGVLLTEKGKRFYYHAKSILSEAKKIECMAKDEEQAVSTLNIASQHILASADMMAEWYQLTKKKAVHLKLIDTNLNQVMAKVQQMDVEIGLISFCNLQMKQIRYTLKQRGLNFTEIVKSPMYAAVGRMHPFYDAEVIHLSDLANYPIIKGIDDEYTMIQSGNVLDGVEFSDFDKVVVMNSTGEIVSFLSQTDALKITGEWNRKPYESFGIHLVPINPNDVWLLLGWIQCRGNTISEEAAEFIELLNELKVSK